jgi:hypothetical protein
MTTKLKNQVPAATAISGRKTMKAYTFSFEQNGEQITTSTFTGSTKAEARKWAQLYKRRELRNDYPSVKLNKVKIS